ncbi:MAG TPA: DEAD/DEAH box helicase, partial [Clostridia bacterium]|nr:DEAD/DEAH box helicase [Clostridia bacterium]
TLGAFVRGGSVRELLVWAVCGAGKTEVAFDAIAASLDAGARVLYAVPRRDVVLELFPRFKKAFPGVGISVLYGGCRYGRFDDAQLTLATTHQVIRFYKNFDIVVLDEVDAFPYRGSRMLYDAVERARVPGGKIIYLTATPRPEYLKGVREGRITLVTIPARHHGFPLPVPRIVKTQSLRDREGRFRMPASVRDFLHKSIEGDKAQVFVFVPAVALVKKVADVLQEEVRLPPFNNWHGDWVKGSHARDPDRDVKREAFSRGDFPVFVTTSIMERGITVPNANVLVLFAEYERIYDTGTLVQMAGRSGRTTDYPEGRVLFVGTRITPAMGGAVDQIVYMNKEALAKGYLGAGRGEASK